MTPHSRAQTAYAQSQTATRTPRGTEYAAFQRVTDALRAADRDGAPFAALADAVHRNRQLWTLLAADVADEANGLTPQLRAQIFYLAEFTRQHSGQVLARSADVAPLVDINLAIMRGLRGMADAA